MLNCVVLSFFESCLLGMQEEQQLDRLPPNVNTSAVASNGVETTSPKTAFLSYEEIGPSAPLAVRVCFNGIS